MDFEKMLRAYLDHVRTVEGTDFLGGKWLLPQGLSPEEMKRLIEIGDEQASLVDHHSPRPATLA